MIPFEQGSRSRRAMESGWLGRRRNYKCIMCGEKFQHDGFRLPDDSRVCYRCRQTPDGLARYDNGFITQRAKEESQGMIP